MIRRPPRSPLFPYPPLFRSVPDPEAVRAVRLDLIATPRLQTKKPADIRRAFSWAKNFSAHIVSTKVDTYQSRSRDRSEEHTSELQSRLHLVCRLLLEKKKKI